MFSLPAKIIFYLKDYLIYFYSLSVFLFSTVQRCVDCNAVRRARRKTFLREESERLFENSESLTRGKCCFFFFFCCRLKIFFKRTIAVLCSSQCFPIPRVVVKKKSFSTRKNILFLYFLLSLYFLFHNPRMC